MIKILVAVLLSALLLGALIADFYYTYKKYDMR